MTAIQRARKLLQFLGEDLYFRDGETETLAIANERYRIWICKNQFGFTIRVSKLAIICMRNFCPITHVHVQRGSITINRIPFDVYLHIQILPRDGREEYYVAREFRTVQYLTAKQLIDLIFKLL